MNVARTFDVGVCLSVLTNEHIFKEISEDGATFNHLYVDVINHYWLSISVKGVLIGVVQFKPITSACFESHIHILKEFRKMHSHDAGENIIQWCTEYLSGTLYAHTPEYCKNVMRFLEMFDFKNTGVIPKSFKKNAELHDLVIYTRVI